MITRGPCDKMNGHDLFANNLILCKWRIVYKK